LICTGPDRNLSLLQQRYPAAQQIAVDIAPSYAQHADSANRHESRVTPLVARATLQAKITPLSFKPAIAEHYP